MAHALYSDRGLHFQIRTTGIAHMSNNPELYIESLSGVSWQQYIQEMSQQGTWCDNVIIQAVSNVLDCTIYITDSNPNSTNATVINPVHCCQNSRIVFLGYVNNLHYVSTCSLKNSADANNLNLLKRKSQMPKPKREEVLAKKRQRDKQTKACETEQERKLRLARIREHNKQCRAIETDDERKLRLAKMAKHAKSRRAEETDEERKLRLEKRRKAEPVGKIEYLNNFDTLKNGQLHEQSWAKSNIKDFHKSMQFSVLQCTICKEAWPIKSTRRSLSNYTCLRCTRDKNVPKKFSCDNFMIPRSVPAELQGLTQTEEMLIARALPIMRIYIKPGGQRGYSGHCINLPQNINELALVLPRYPKDLSIIVIKVKGKDNTFKDVNVRREKVHNALLWLKCNNPHYKDVTIDQHALNSLPANGALTDLMTVESDSDIVSDDMISPDLGPPTYHDEEDKVYNHSSEFSSFMPVTKQQQQELDAIKEQLSPKEAINWPTVDDNPLNEYQTPFLATLAFPTLFPDGTGDPTNPSLLKDISLAEKVKHLIKFAEVVDGKWVYRFASHPRFAFWAFDMIQRKRTLQQSGIFLKQNPGEAHLTVDELRQMATSNNSSAFFSKISRYVANIAGSKAYWYKVREDLKAIITTVGTPTIFFTFSSADMHWPELHDILSSNKENSQDRRQAVINNPHIADWFFCQRLESFVKHWLYGSLDAKWHWYRFEYQARGSIHCHGTAKLNNDPGLCELTQVALKGFLAKKCKNEQGIENCPQLDNDIKAGDEAAQKVCKYVD